MRPRMLTNSHFYFFGGKNIILAMNHSETCDLPVGEPEDALVPEITEDVDARQSLIGRFGRKALAAAMLTLCLTGVKSSAETTDEIFLRNSDARQEIENGITVMTANVHSWSDLNGQPNIDRFTSEVSHLKPDVICMQEVLADGKELQQIYKLGYSVYFHTTLEYPFRGKYGNAFATNAPVSSVVTEFLPSTSLMNLQPRNIIYFDIETAEGELSFGNVHLSTTPGESQRQLEHIGRNGRRLDFLCGDLNQTSDTVESGPLAEMASNNTGGSDAETFPAHKPNRKIDHILSSCGIRATEPVLKEFGSDHLLDSERFFIWGCSGEQPRTNVVRPAVIAQN